MSADRDPIDCEPRLVEVEAKLTLADDLLDTLNLTVYRQQQRIERLEGELRMLREQVDALNAGLSNSPHQELPPHY